MYYTNIELPDLKNTQDKVEIVSTTHSQRTLSDTFFNNAYTIHSFRENITLIKSIKNKSKIENHLNKLKFQLDKYKLYIDNSDWYLNTYHNVINDVLSLNLELRKLSISKDQSITFYLSNNDLIDLSFEVFKESEGIKVVYSIYDNDVLISLNSGSLSFVKKQILKEISTTSSYTKNFVDISSDTRLFEFQF